MRLPRPTLSSRPALRPPPGGWDCHVHVFGPRAHYPLALDRRYTPGLATVDDLAAAMERSGLSHAVLVQPSPYGADHACLVDALAATAERCTGVASFAPDAPLNDTALALLDDAGVRGLRVQALRKDDSEALSVARRGADVARDVGWSLEIQIADGRLALAERLAAEVEVTIVLDHLARIRAADIERLLALLSDRDVFVKISALYRQPDRRAAIDAARILLAEAPDRCLWGSDWPHTPPHPADPAAAACIAPFRKIDVAQDFDAVFRGAPERTLRSVLCETPARLYARRASLADQSKLAQ